MRFVPFGQKSIGSVAEVLFNDLNVDAYFLEYDDERSGDFAPLRFVPDNKVVVLGIMSSKLAELESEASLITRIKEASAYLALDNMCISFFSNSFFG